MMNHVVTIARKELREAMRTTRLYVLLTLVYGTFLQWFIIRNYVAAIGGNPEILRLAVSISLVYVPMMVIPFFANTVLTRSLVEEKIKQSLMPLLATGVSPGLVWLTKLLTAFGLGYLVSLLCTVTDLLMIRYYFHLGVVFSARVLAAALFFSPLATLGLLAIMAFLFWTVKQANVVAAFVPVVATLGIWGYVSDRPTTGFGSGLIALVVVVPILVLVICALGISRVRRQHIVGL